MNRSDAILQYWFGHIEDTGMPSEHRTHIWFSGSADVDAEVKSLFSDDLERAINDEYAVWEKDPRSLLALIILFDQFSRHIYRDKPQAFAQDRRALNLCLQGIQQEFDHALSLIERVFFYFPLMHAENLEMQATGVRAFQILINLTFPETRPVFQNFLEYAVKHYEVIKRFGRFPQRNKILGRESTPEEIEFLSSPAAEWRSD